MDVVTLDLAIFLVATFAAALVAGLAGFAFGLVAAAVWLHLLTPLQTASLIIAFGLIVQGVAVWKLRHALQWDRLWPFLLGGLLGVPIGVVVLAWANPDHMRAGVGALLILYSVHGLVRPATQPILAGGAPADAGVGLLNGILGGATGLAGILVTIWCGLRGWPSDNVHWRELYERSGRLTSSSMGRKRTGKWRIEKDQLCVEFEKEPPGCYDVWASGKKVRLQREGMLPLEGVIEAPTGRM